jgi:hypothetical protein
VEKCSKLALAIAPQARAWRPTSSRYRLNWQASDLIVRGANLPCCAPTQERPSFSICCKVRFAGPRDRLGEFARRLKQGWRGRVISLPHADQTWRYSRPVRRDDPSQGWKLHVSATPLSAREVLSRVHPVLFKRDVLFKVPANLELLAELNCGLHDFSQVGKFLTAYPRSTGEAVALARELHRATRGLDGPQIPFDAHYRRKSLVYYRYGAFRPTGGRRGLIRGPTGKTLRDRRAPGRAVPSWLDDPFNMRRRETARIKGPIGTDFFVFKVNMQRGKGGVYQAVDMSVSPARRVIIKEGRRHGETDWAGKDGRARVKHEGHVLRRLRKAGMAVPEVFREFVQNGNRYLALEKIAGRPLIPANRIQPARISWRRAAEILDQLGAILSRVHAAGWVWRDCKPSNILVHRGQFWLIDFEGACRIDRRDVLPWASANYYPHKNRKSFRRRAGVLEDDYALGVIAFQFGTGKFPPADAHRRGALYNRSHCPDSLRKKIERLLDSKI